MSGIPIDIGGSISTDGLAAPLAAGKCAGPSDVELMRGMIAGDRDALATLYDRYAAQLCGIGVCILGERRDAEDVVHDVMLEVWNKAADYDEARGTVRAWLFLRFRCRCLDRRKQASERLDRSLAELQQTSMPCARVLADERCSALDARRLHRGLLALPDEQRLVLDLSYFAGLSGSEISRRLDLPLGTVKSRVAAALRKLRLALDAPDDFCEPGERTSA